MDGRIGSRRGHARANALRLMASAALALGAALSAAPSASACCWDNDRTIVGTPHGDDIRGTARDEDILTKGGADTARARAGHDVVSGGDGRDDLAGQAGPDRLFGGRGDDTLSGVAGEADTAFDVLFCGAGTDTAFADRIDRVSDTCERVFREG